MLKSKTNLTLSSNSNNTEQIKILLVDDDHRFTATAKEILENKLYKIDVLNKGGKATDFVLTNNYDLLILDVMIPEVNGITICRNLRSNDSAIPILLLTALTQKNDKLKAFEAGADDYLVKPVDWDELIARIRALLRRKKVYQEQILEWGKIKIFTENKQSFYEEEKLNLTPTQFEILQTFLRQPNRVYSYEDILQQLWELWDGDPPTNDTIRSHIKGLRKSLEKAGAPKDIIETQYRLGYRIKKLDTTDKQGKLTTQKEQKTNKEKDINKEKRELQQKKIETALQIMWQQYKQSVWDDLQVLDDYNNNLTVNLNREDVIRKAHSLVGFLGSLGLKTASNICREIENLLTNNKDNQKIKIELEKLSSNLKNLDELQLNQNNNTVTSEHSTQQAYLMSQILMIADSSSLTKKLQELGTCWNLNLELIDDFSEIKTRLETEKYRGIIVEFNPEAKKHENRKKIIEFLKEKYPHFPLIILSKKDDLPTRLEIAKYKVNSFISQNLFPEQIIKIVYQLLHTSSAKKVILVDDDCKFHQIFRQILAEDNLEIITLSDPYQLLDLMETIIPELLILDLQMPKVNGIDLCRVIRNDPRWDKLPIIFLTAYLTEDIIDQLIAVGADDFISKSKIELDLHNRIIMNLQRSQRLEKTDIVFN
jgi:DNA-binding response OmpR family regulator/HPt (histidine-containing phosphotransfer) domain-containing protein